MQQLPQSIFEYFHHLKRELTPISSLLSFLPAWNLDAMLEVEQPSCDHKVSIRIKGLERGWSFNGKVELFLNNEKEVPYLSKLL